MKCKIVYFSMTGNTKLAAEKVKEGLESAGHEVTLEEMRDIGDDSALESYDLLGFMAPVYCFSAPNVFKKFLKGLPRLEGKPAFVATTAADIVGGFFKHVEKLLRKKGVVPFARSWFRAPSSYTAWNKPEGQEYEFTEESKRQAFDFGASLPGEYQAVLVEKSKTLPKAKAGLAARFVAALSDHNFTLRALLKKWEVDRELCDGCGTCVSNCAWGALSQPAPKSPPVYDRKKCGGCFACINVCPKGAIKSKSVVGKVKYREPSYHGYQPGKKV
ncbi:MAG: EFR1 family ferrodoxin [Promethearchaeota archaeon]